MISKRTWITLCSAAALAGCTTTVGRDFSTERVSQMRINETTTEQTIAALGEPYSRNIAPDGSEQWVYKFSQYKNTPTAKSFIPFVGPYTSNSSKQSQLDRTLELAFDNGVLSQCSMKIRESNGRGNIASAGMEAATAGTTQEIACGNGEAAPSDAETGE